MDYSNYMMYVDCAEKDALKELVQIAYKEDWRLLDNKKTIEYWALQRYLKYTFERLAYEESLYIENVKQYTGKIKAGKDLRNLLIDTGLVDSKYNNIYGIIKVGDINRFGKWTCKYTGFFANGVDSPTLREAERVFGLHDKHYYIPMNSLPWKADYYESDDLLFNPGYSFQEENGFSHIINDRLFRFPEAFIRNVISDGSTAEELIGYLRLAARAEEAGDKDEMSRIMAESVVPILTQGNDSIYMEIHNRLKDAVNLAVKKARYDYHIAVLGYYPEEKTLKFYLPLCLVYNELPDLALIVSQWRDTPSYIPTTVLQLDEAYADTRLLGPSIGSWIYQAAKETRHKNNAAFFSTLTNVLPEADDEDARAVLEISDKYSTRTQTIMTGYKIGRRHGFDYIPDIELDDSYEYVAKNQGQFNCHGGTWSFVPRGTNATRVRRLVSDSGNVKPRDYVLENGVAFELKNEDRLIFGREQPRIMFLLAEN